MFLNQKFVILNLTVLINFIVKTDQEETKDSRDDEIERLRNELKRMEERVNRLNETSKPTHVNRYTAVKNYIERFETFFGSDFEPRRSHVCEDTPEGKNMETRRQKCEYILEKKTHAHQVDHVLRRLSEAFITQYEFCSEIAKAYSICFQKLETNGGSSPENGSLFDDPNTNKCVEILTLSFTEFHPKFQGKDEFVRVPKSMYLDWMKKDAQVADLKTLHDKKMKSLKRALNRVRARLEKHY